MLARVRVPIPLRRTIISAIAKVAVDTRNAAHGLSEQPVKSRVSSLSPNKGVQIMRVLLLTTASAALIASAGVALAQPHERGGGHAGPGGAIQAPGGAPGGA